MHPSATATGTVTRYVDAQAARKTIAGNEFALTRREAGSMDSAWIASIAALITDVVIDEPARVTCLVGPETRDQQHRRQWRLITGTVEYGPYRDDLLFLDEVAVDLTECTGFAVTL